MKNALSYLEGRIEATRTGWNLTDPSGITYRVSRTAMAGLDARLTAAPRELSAWRAAYGAWVAENALKEAR